MVEAFAPGKVILLGEHAVVYGHPALAAPLGWGVTARGTAAPRCSLAIPSRAKGPTRKLIEMAFDRAAAACGRPHVRVELDDELPASMGLGSSAALSVACAKVLLRAAERKDGVRQVLKVALEMERAFHGTPSGVDHTCSAMGRLIRFQRGRAREVKSRRPLKILVALSGERRPTRETVGALRARVQRWPRRYKGLLAQVGALADEGARAIASGELESLGDAMNVNQGLLSALGLSSEAIDQMVHRLKGMGALGAKLTGAGGDGGAVIGLFLEPEPAAARLSRMGVRCFSSQVAGPPAL